MQVSLIVLEVQEGGKGVALGEGGSVEVGGAKTAFSMTSAMCFVRQEPKEDLNMREILSLRPVWFSMAKDSVR